MSRGIVPQYIKRTGPARHINKQTKIQTDIPVIQEILAEKVKATKSFAFIRKYLRLLASVLVMSLMSQSLRIVNAT